MKLSDKQAIVEQIALLFASFVWTTVILSVIALYWVYQDINARWDYIAQIPPEALAQVTEVTATPLATIEPTPTWPQGQPTQTPTITPPPTPTGTRVVPEPGLLPETPVENEPTPIPVVVHTEEEAAEFNVELNSETTTEEVAVVPTLPPPTRQPTTQPQTQSQEAAPAPSGGSIQPAKLVIESVGIDTPIIPVGWDVVEQDGRQYSIWQVADNAVGWHKTTAGLGQAGNTVMAGHHNVQGEVFRDLVNVEVGDRVIAYGSDNQVYEYVVELKTIVKEKGEPLEVRQRNAQWISKTDDERLTFVTCWPYTNNTHRVIVVAKPL